MQVFVHGGAGSPPDEPDERQAVLDEAADRGAREADVVSAVETAIRGLESDPQFNAGVGGALQSDGVVRTDAGIMTGDLSVGAACSMPGVEHAISVARGVCDETPHILLAGPDAVSFAADLGVEVECDLFSDRTRSKWADLNPPAGGPVAQLAWVQDQFGGGDGTIVTDGCRDHDTVGAVAWDGEEFAAGTSTGGRWLALAGRVGDVPQVGSGFYATGAGAASATGAGEDIARVTLCQRAVHHLETGVSASTAAEAAIEEFEELTGSTAGVIVIGDDGVGQAYNSDAMQTSVETQ